MILHDLVLDVLCENEDGLNHPQIVKKILEKGHEETDLSAKVHQAVLSLVYTGLVKKNLETRIVKLQNVYANCD